MSLEVDLSSVNPSDEILALANILTMRELKVGASNFTAVSIINYSITNYLKRVA